MLSIQKKIVKDCHKAPWSQARTLFEELFDILPIMGLYNTVSRNSP